MRRHNRRAQPFPEFEEPEPGHTEADLAGIEAELSRELEPGFAEQHRNEAWQDNEPTQESKVASAVVPGASRRAAAARAAAAQRSRSRVGLVTAGAAVLVIVIAAGAALYLRAPDSSSSGPPPVIAADAEPVRVEPEVNASAAEGETVGEAVYDRVSGANSQTEEQVVDNAEEPREIARIVLPPSQDTASAAAEDPVGGEASGDVDTAETGQPAVDAAATSATEPAAADELGPRLVPTYVVRADGSIVETSAASSTATDPTEAQNQQLVTETEPIEPVPVPTVAIEDSGTATDATAAEPSTLTAAPAQETPPAPATADSEELSPRPSIDDETTALASATPPSEPAPAAADETTPDDSLASAEPAATPAPSASGGYLVQLSAQRSMDEAQSAYAAAQQRYASVLSSLTPQIQEADLGAKGIFYRVRVGPWESRDDAIKVCEALKEEGGNCFVTQ
jgi:hypothetical protein